MIKNPRIKALAKWMHQESGDESETFYAQEMRPKTYDKCVIQVGSSANAPDYLVLSDKEADKYAAERIKESVWAFRPEFVASHSKLSYESTLSIFRALADKCEGANDDILSLIKNMKKFVQAAISADGRGHFLSGYDGQEHEVRVGAKTYYIYRVN